MSTRLVYRRLFVALTPSGRGRDGARPAAGLAGPRPASPSVGGAGGEGERLAGLAPRPHRRRICVSDPAASRGLLASARPPPPRRWRPPGSRALPRGLLLREILRRGGAATAADSPHGPRRPITARAGGWRRRGAPRGRRRGRPVPGAGPCRRASRVRASPRRRPRAAPPPRPRAPRSRARRRGERRWGPRRRRSPDPVGGRAPGSDSRTAPTGEEPARAEVRRSVAAASRIRRDAGDSAGAPAGLAARRERRPRQPRARDPPGERAQRDRPSASSSSHGVVESGTIPSTARPAPPPTCVPAARPMFRAEREARAGDERDAPHHEGRQVGELRERDHDRTEHVEVRRLVQRDDLAAPQHERDRDEERAETDEPRRRRQRLPARRAPAPRPSRAARLDAVAQARDAPEPASRRSVTTAADDSAGRRRRAWEEDRLPQLHRPDAVRRGQRDERARARRTPPGRDDAVIHASPAMPARRTAPRRSR